MTIEVFKQKPPIKIQLSPQEREQFAESGLAHLRESISLGIKYKERSGNNPRVFAFIRNSFPSGLPFDIPEGYDDGRRESLWHKLLPISTGTPLEAVYHQVLNSLDDSESAQQLEQARRHLQDLLNPSGERSGFTEGEKASRHIDAARVLDYLRYDASGVLTTAIKEIDALEQSNDADFITPNSMELLYEDVVGAAVDGRYFKIADLAINHLKELAQRNGDMFSEDTISECLAYLGVAELNQVRNSDMSSWHV